MDVEVVVPGHGNVADKGTVKAMRDYLQYIQDEAFTRFQAGMPASEAAFDIPLGSYADWNDAERVVVTVATLYAGFKGEETRFQPLPLFEQMAKMRCKLKTCRCHGGPLRAA